MIVMAAQKKSKLKRFFLGSSAEKVVRRASLPVLLAHPGDHSDVFQKIICAIHLSPSSEQVIFSSIHLARILGREIEFLHVDNEGLGLKDIIDGVKELYLGDDLDEVQKKYSEHITQVREKVDDYLSHFDTIGLTMTVSVKSGVPEKVIHQIADNEPDILLVIGAHGHSGLIHDHLIG